MLASVLRFPAASAEAGARTLVTYRTDGAPPGHDRESRANVAKRLAEAMHWRYGGELDASGRYATPLYVVPHDALLVAEAEALGIRGPGQLFGGVVPHAFVATKAITHPLISRDAAAPEGWSHACALEIGETALRGFTAFDREDAHAAAGVLLRAGPVRIKCVAGIGGAGQHLVHDAAELDAALASVEDAELATSGVSVEEHLEHAVTYSVGAVACGEVTIAYCGTQSVTENPRGHEVYGGSTLDIVRGGFEDLLARGLPQRQYEAVELARAYDAAAFAAYPDAYASRRNYDVLFGRDALGRMRSGVLEQSWRIGGASGAEVLAIDAFRRSRIRSRIRCATVEIYDDACPVPEGAFVYYRGVDPRAGPLTKYAIAIDGHDA